MLYSLQQKSYMSSPGVEKLKAFIPKIVYAQDVHAFYPRITHLQGWENAQSRFIQYLNNYWVPRL
jgi:hypothetical protein